MTDASAIRTAMRVIARVTHPVAPASSLATALDVTVAGGGYGGEHALVLRVDAPSAIAAILSGDPTPKAWVWESTFSK